MVEVVVVGGGPAGVAAAVAAGRMGARTLLVERMPRLGGNAANAFVHTICGLFLDAAAGDAVAVQPGFGARFARALRAVGAAGEPERAGRVWVLPTEPARVPDGARALCEATPQLELRLGTALTGARLARDGATPHTLTLSGDTGTETLDARVVVDTSGDAAAAAAGAADVDVPDPEALQLPSYIFRLAQVHTAGLAGFERLRLTSAVAHAAREGALAQSCESVLVRRALAPGEVYVTLNVPRPAAYAPLDDAARERLEQQARAAAEELTAYLRKSRPAFAACRVAAWPARIGVRESRRIAGRAELTRDDVLAGRRREDEVALSSWPIELWHDHRRARFEYPEGPCGVPLGALVSRSHPRVGAAGRCMAGSHEALGALRVIGTALATGEAIGVAAALAADAGTGLDAVDPAAVRHHVRDLAEREAT